MEVCEGELINLQGKILSVDGNKITIMPKHEDLKVAESPGCSSGCLGGGAMTTLGPLPCASLLSPPLLGHAGVPSSGAAQVFQDG